MRRFIHAHTDGVWEDENGQWVLYEEAQAENARLRKALEGVMPYAKIELARLKRQYDNDPATYPHKDLYESAESAITAAREIIRETAALRHRD